MGRIKNIRLQLSRGRKVSIGFCSEEGHGLSLLAHEAVRNFAGKGVEVFSFHSGETPAGASQEVLDFAEKNNLHKVRQARALPVKSEIVKRLLKKADLIITLDRSHERLLEALKQTPRIAGKVKTLSSFGKNEVFARLLAWGRDKAFKRVGKTFTPTENRLKQIIDQARAAISSIRPEDSGLTHLKIFREFQRKGNTPKALKHGLIFITTPAALLPIGREVTKRLTQIAEKQLEKYARKLQREKPAEARQETYDAIDALRRFGSKKHLKNLETVKTKGDIRAQIKASIALDQIRKRK